MSKSFVAEEHHSIFSEWRMKDLVVIVLTIGHSEQVTGKGSGGCLNTSR